MIPIWLTRAKKLVQIKADNIWSALKRARILEDELLRR